MRLFEIIDTLSKKTNRSFNDLTRAYRDKLGAKPLGAGGYAVGYELTQPTRQNEIIKISKERNEDHFDPYEEYVGMVEDFNKKGGHNRYFPRIISHRSFRRNGKVYSKTGIEKLVPFKHPKIIGNKELLDSLANDMFYIEDDMQHLINPTFIVSRIRNGINGRYSDIKDEELKEACEMIHTLITNWNGTFLDDLHEGNVMWRITGNRPQLVITDPISSIDY